MQLLNRPSQRLALNLPGLAPEGLPILGMGAAVTGATALFSRRLAAVPLVLTLGAAYFFRDPPRVLPGDASFLYSAADGRVLRVEEVDEPRFIRGRALRIATFLSLFDVHVNRSATDGTVRYLEHVPGSFAAAWGEDVHEVNERQYIGLETAHGPVLLIQIAGLVARRIVCHAQTGDELRAGERFGMIKFGSRTDVLLPAGAARPLVVAGMRVTAGITPVGVWNG
ncbi:MAG TPA: phosphatidylserine decarboxylase [Herpetosiphonaceae bacterium]